MAYKEFVSEKLVYSIGEVAEMLGESVSLVRFWSDKFPAFIKPQRNAKGNRRFSSKDVETLKLIHYLVKKRGMTLDGAADRLKENREGLDHKMAVIERLASLRSQLVELSESLKGQEEDMETEI